jgi:hypothetical protein
MNSMEEEATQLESEVLRKILRQPKESAHQENKTKDLMTATATVYLALPLPVPAPRLAETVTLQRAGGIEKQNSLSYLGKESNTATHDPREVLTDFLGGRGQKAGKEAPA